ncbi:putative phosphoenolpyruvate synthase [Argiope bruennichi]|uniref:putative phosphoenolpyruvate synthase n=1 Tax=Argiope bruennichi TaxID=94029 RepID=UPI00249475EE|nr:putative phosphoenolpyruvate synthase [Argiope bruennichi]
MGAIIATPVTIIVTILSAKPSDVVYWTKWIASYICIELYKRSHKKRFDWYDMGAKHDPQKSNFLPNPEEAVLESPLLDSQLVNTADEIFFYGVNSKSEYFVTRIARGPNQEAEAWIYLKLSNGKVYQLQETSGYQQSCCDKRVFTCGGLQIHYLSPMRRWRIFFNGILRETDENDPTSDRNVHVKFAVLWRASSDTFDYISDINSSALATGLAKARWNQYLPPVGKLYSTLNCYVQTGVIAGTIKIEGYEDELNVYLFGEKIRFLGNFSMEDIKFTDALGYVFKNGRFAHVAEISIENVVKNLTVGFITAVSGEMENFEGSKNVLINLTDIGEKDIVAKFNAEGEEYMLHGEVDGKNSNSNFDCFNFELNGLKGTGVVFSGKIKKSKRVLSENETYPTPAVIPLVVPFSEKVCQNPDITGGKGSSLGKLTELSKDFKSFTVPSGMVVTTGAYQKFLTDEILKQIKSLEKVLYSDKVDETKIACQRIIDEVINTNMPESVFQAVVTNLEKVFPDKKNNYKFAVRSSATGEDTEQMSAAGQMETFLGVEGINEIMTAIKKCWASQFGYIAVQYKRQNGQIINSPMAVVVQQMISCDVAGVLFTCDPLTGNPTSMSITGNYGLGESVVSGSDEPDTIEIERHSDGNLTIKNKLIGSKRRRIVLKDDGGTEFEDVQEQDKQICCLTDNMALRLAQLALKIEKSYRSYRDIEWGFWNNNLYIFQSRPVTSGAGETEFEIDHEFDGPLRNERDYFTTCNIGEVMPGATSPLGIEVALKFFETVFKNPDYVGFHRGDLTNYYPRGIQTWYNHLMFCILDLFHQVSDNSEQVQANSIGLFGRLMDDKELFEMAIERNRKHQAKKSSLKENVKRMYRLLYGSKRAVDKTLKHYEKYNVPVVKFNNSVDMFKHLMYCCTDLHEAFETHLMVSNCSSFLNIYIFLILQKAIGEINSDVYNDFARLITAREVESADVPSAMELLARSIIKEMKPEDFKTMDIDEALKWLETSSSNASKAYKEFLEKHGHRCLRELDIRSVTWKDDPKALIKSLQHLVVSIRKDKGEEDSDDIKEIIDDLKAPLSFKNKLSLRLILSLSRKTVQFRETSKSIMIRNLNQWRKGYRKLAKLMVLEGRIPDEDLLYFMTMEEINELLETRSPKIIAKANLRRRRHPVLDKYIFPEINKGFPMPINAGKKIVHTNDSNFTMKGIPVSAGIAMGVVRVALDLDDASLLQPGEILVTYATDIGWSPYFPILGGVVTEIGGLISHGAVVSREYGLPCISGVHGATQQFQTGDYVLLDGTKGIVQRIPKKEDS